MTNINKVIEFRGFNNLFMGLLENKNENKYYLFIAKYYDANIFTITDSSSAYGRFNEKLFEFISNIDIKFEAKFYNYENTIFNIFSLQNKQEYYTIVKVLETIYGK